ncbi:MAG: tetratricopeptide repeat protein [Bdellovibrionales bacterium]|nr:tetratricopeptide repeat protein [Bdellovibrionales bacterium]
MFGFIALDDAKHIWQNPYVSNLSIANLQFFWREAYYGLYIPVTYNVWAVLAEISQSLLPTHAITRFSAMPFHFLNLSLHLINVWLTFQLLQYWLVTRSSEDSKSLSKYGKDHPLWLTAQATLPFGLHPLQVEPVAWASGLKDVMMTHLCLAATFYYLRAINEEQLNSTARKKKGKKKSSDKKSSAPNLPFLFQVNIPIRLPFFLSFMVLAHFAVALLVKPSALTMLVLVTALHLFHFRRLWKSRIPVLGLMLTLSAVLVFWTKNLQPSSRLEFDYGFFERIQTAMASLGFYVYKTLWPVGLSPDYGLTPPKLMNHPMNWLFYLLGSTVMAGLVFSAIRKNRAALGLTLLTGGLLPVLGLVPFEYQNISTVADRYMHFVPMLGVGLVLVSVVEGYFSDLTKQITITLAVALAALSFMQTRNWRDNQALFSQVLTVNPNSHLAYNNLGLFFLRAKEFEKAEANLKKAIGLKDQYLAAQSNLGVVYFRQKNFAKVVDYYTSVLAQYPEKTAGDPATFADMHFNLGAALVNTGKVEQSVRHLRKATEINVLHFKAHLQLGRVLAHLGQYEQAKRSLENAYRLNPKDQGLQQALALLMQKLNNQNK